MNSDKDTIEVCDKVKRKEKCNEKYQKLFNEIKQYEQQLKETKILFNTINTTPDEVSISGHIISKEYRKLSLETLKVNLNELLRILSKNQKT